MAQKRKFYVKTASGVEEQLIASSADIVGIESIDGINATDVQGALEEIKEIADTGGVTGIKGNAETTYRKGDVNITPANIGLGNVTDDAQVKRSEMGVAGGVATLDTAGKVPSAQLPSYVDDIVEGYLSATGFYLNSDYTDAVEPENSKIYVDCNTNKTYRWSTSRYVEISESLALGTTSSTAFPGDRGAEVESKVEALEPDVEALQQVSMDALTEIKTSAKSYEESPVQLSTTHFWYNTTATATFEDGVTREFDMQLDVPLKPGENISFTKNTNHNAIEVNAVFPDTGVTAGTYSAVSVDEKGRVTAGSQIIEWGASGQSTPSDNLAVGGLFFALVE